MREDTRWPSSSEIWSRDWGLSLAHGWGFQDQDFRTEVSGTSGCNFEGKQKAPPECRDPRIQGWAFRGWTFGVQGFRVRDVAMGIEGRHKVILEFRDPKIQARGETSWKWKILLPAFWMPRCRGLEDLVFPPQNWAFWPKFYPSTNILAIYLIALEII